MSGRERESLMSRIVNVEKSWRKREREIERDFYIFFESASGRFEPTTPV